MNFAVVSTHMKGDYDLKRVSYISLLVVLLVLSLTKTQAIVFKSGLGVTATQYLSWSTTQRTQYAVGFYDGLCAGPLVMHERATYLEWFFKMPEISTDKLESVITTYIINNPQRANDDRLGRLRDRQMDAALHPCLSSRANLQRTVSIWGDRSRHWLHRRCGRRGADGRGAAAALSRFARDLHHR